MVWFSTWFSGTARTLGKAEALAARQRYHEALTLLEPLTGPDVDALRERLGEKAARAHLDRAMAACHAGDAREMKAEMAIATRYYRPELGSLFRLTRRSVRSHRISHTAPEHWVKLLAAAERQGARYFGAKATAVGGIARYRTFEDDRIRAKIAELTGEDPDPERLEALSEDALDVLQTQLMSRWPDDLAQSIPRLGEDFLRGSIQLALGRPDLAVLAFLEGPEQDPVVCVERARAAWCLGYPRLSIVALQGFRTQIGGHRVIGRLHTGVFLAQMFLAVSDRDAARAALADSPIRLLGLRPTLLYAQLLIEASSLREAEALLAEHTSRHPEHVEAARLLHKLRAAETDPGGGETATQLSVQGLLFEENP